MYELSLSEKLEQLFITFQNYKDRDITIVFLENEGVMIYLPNGITYLELQATAEIFAELLGFDIEDIIILIAEDTDNIILSFEKEVDD